MNVHGGNIYDKKIEYDFSININPLGCPASVLEAIQSAINNIDKYPEYRPNSLKKKLAMIHPVDHDRIVITAGASEALMTICRVLFDKGVNRAYLITPCFLGYEYALGCNQCEIIRCRTLAEICEKDDLKNSVVFISNPNNPDGTIYSRKDLYEYIKKLGGKGAYAVVDECFLPLSDAYNQSVLQVKDNLNTSELEHLFVVRSFTKTFGMPGLRLGYLVAGSAEIAEHIERQLPEWNVAGPAVEAGLRALDCIVELDYSRNLIKKEREYLEQELSDISLHNKSNAIIRYKHSYANFILFRIDNGEALMDFLLQKGILIRDCSNYDSLENGYYRVAILTHEKNEVLVAALREFFGVVE